MHCHPLLAEAEAVADFLLGPVDRSPIYIVPSSEAGERFRCTGGAVAFTGPGLCFGLAPLLRAAGQWRGLGFAVVVDVDGVVKKPGHPVTNAVGIIAHELAHFLDRKPPADLGQFDQRIVEEVLAPSDVDYSYYAPVQTIPPWHGHEWKFIRAACHLTSRLRRLRKDITNQRVQFAGEQYGLSPARAYMSTLQDELCDGRNRPIRSVLATEPPAAFMDLWTRDTYQ